MSCAITVSCNSSSASTGSSTKSRTAFPLCEHLAARAVRRYGVNGHPRPNAHEDVELKRQVKQREEEAQISTSTSGGRVGASRRWSRTRAAPDERIFEVAAQRLQDVTNALGTHASLPPICQRFQYLSTYELTLNYSTY